MPEDRKKRQITPEEEIQKEWNNLVQGFLDAQLAWERIKFILGKIPNQDTIEPELQRFLTRVCVTTRFRYAVESFTELLGIRNNVEDLFVKKEIKDEE